MEYEEHCCHGGLTTMFTDMAVKKQTEVIRTNTTGNRYRVYRFRAYWHEGYRF